MQARRLRSQQLAAQFTLDFSDPDEQKSCGEGTQDSTSSLENQILRVASDYRLQMQAYALAVGELMPDLVKAGGEVKVTLHFLDPNLEYHLSEDLLDPETCARAIDHAFLQLISSRDPEQFPVRPAIHCRMCNFLQICAGGRAWLAENQQGAKGQGVNGRKGKAAIG